MKHDHTCAEAACTTAPGYSLVLHAAAARPAPAPALLQSIVALCGGRNARLQTLDHPQWRERAYRIAVASKPAPDSEQARQLQQCCEQAALDLAWLETWSLETRSLETRSLNDFGLLAMDMDSTLITIECIDEIADMQGLKPQVAAITEAAMRGEIADYKDSLRQRVALLRGVTVRHMQQVLSERLQLNPGAAELVAACKAAGLKVLLVSGGFTFFTDHVRDLLRIDFTRSNVLEIRDGVLTGRMVDQPWGDICDGEEKKRMVLQTCAQLGISAAQAIAMGDGANDLPMMQACADAGGLSVAYHAKPRVREQAMVAIHDGGLDRLLEVLR